MSASDVNGPRLRSISVVAAFALGVLCLTTPFARAIVVDGSALYDVRQHKVLRCGVDPGLLGFAIQDDQKQWHGLDIDYCRAIAAAVLGDPKEVEFIPVIARERFKALEYHEIDVLVRDTAWTMARDTTYGLTFLGVNYYNGQGFMVPRALGIDSALQLSGARVCVETGSATEVAVTAWFKTHSMAYTPVPVEDDDKQKAAYEDGHCNVFTGDIVGLHAARLNLAKPDDSVVLPDVFAKEAYGPVVSRADYRWQAVVKWVHFALLDAEELGVTSTNIDAMMASDDSDVRQLLGVDGELGKALELDRAWAARAIRAVGNYGEIFDRNLGSGSRLQIPRGLNALWTNGGIQFAPPVR